jgi:phage N-6-adenine-methyltransferase
MNRELMFSSQTDLWATPSDFFAELDAEFGFDLDVCASPENAKCEKYYTQTDDGLAQPWHGRCWMNPPYGREIGKWVRKAYESHLESAMVVCLLPARTDTKWWHDYCRKGEIRYVKGRIKFGGQENGAPFPSAVVIFRLPHWQYLLASDFVGEGISGAKWVGKATAKNRRKQY